MQCLTQSGSKPDLDCHSIFLVIVATFDSKPDLLGSKPDTVRQHGRHNIDFVVTAGKTKKQHVSFTLPAVFPESRSRTNGIAAHIRTPFHQLRIHVQCFS